jgi:hypothetical protein
MTALAHERPETMTEIRTEAQCLPENGPGLDEALWQAWKAIELPEGYRAEIIEGVIEVSPTCSPVARPDHQPRAKGSGQVPGRG